MNIFPITHEQRFCNELLLHRLVGANEQQTSKKMRLSWLEKYFLIRCVHIYGDEVLIAQPTNLLVPNLGISYRNIVEVRQRLQMAGILTTESVSDGRGRPIEGFRIVADRLADFCVSLSSEEPLHHQALITSLLHWGERDDEACRCRGHGADTRTLRTYLKDTYHSLDGKSRFFLATLLAHADEFGFVDSLGQADIEAMTAFTADQQRRLLKELQNKGYVRSVIKGFTSSHLFGQVGTIYCLNTCKGNIVGQPPLLITLFACTTGMEAHEATEASQLFRIANQIRLGLKVKELSRCIWVRSLVDHNHSVVDLRDFSIGDFSVFSDNSLVDYLQYRLETYATWFLEAPGFNGKESEKMDGQWEGMLNKIKHDAFPVGDANQKRAKIKSSLSTPEHRHAAAVILCQLAWAIAKKYLQYLSQFEPAILASEKRTLRVFPRMYKTPVFNSLSISIASLVRDKSVDHAVAKYVHVRDDRADIQKTQWELSKSKARGELSDSDYRAQLSALEARPELTAVRCHNEVDLDEKLRRQCGLIA